MAGKQKINSITDDIRFSFLFLIDSNVNAQTIGIGVFLYKNNLYYFYYYSPSFHIDKVEFKQFFLHSFYIGNCNYSSGEYKSFETEGEPFAPLVVSKSYGLDFQIEFQVGAYGTYSVSLCQKLISKLYHCSIASGHL